MAELKTCRKCGEAVQTNAPFGHCPQCLIALGFGSPTDEPLEPGGDSALRTPHSALGQVRSFGDYELLEQIGRGGMGIVYKARQLKLNRPVALKMINAGEFASPMLIQRFHREAEAAANLHHPNIVPIYETGEIHGQHFLSMALIEGMGLDEYIKRAGSNTGLAERDARSVSRARQEDIARILAKVARAVDYAHQHGVLHRDLKPSNIIMEPNGEPHLTDFGVAKVLGRGDSSLTASGTIMGTPSYMAPEQAAGHSKHISTAADVYSLGAILYVMLTGSPPFRGETPVETLRQVVEQEPKHPSTLREGIDSDLATISMKCLEKEPLRRYSSASALAEDLERWSRGEPIHARSIHTTERFWRWCRREPKLAGSAAAIVLCLVVITILSVNAWRHAEGRRVEAEQRRVEAERENKRLQKRVLENLIKVYADPNTPFYVIESEDRRAFEGERQGRVVSGPFLELTFVEDVYVHPTNMLETLSPVLRALEDNLSDRLRRPVAIHLLLGKNSAIGNPVLESTNLTFGRMGPASYSHMLDRSNGVRLLAMQDYESPLTMALFTHANSEISRLMDARPGIPLSDLLPGRSLALSGTNSTTGNFVAKWFLAGQGIYSTNLARYEHYSGQARVFDLVRTNAFDAGAGNLENVKDFPDLRVIATNSVQDLGRCWVAGTGMDAATEKALREALLALHSEETLGKLETPTVGFKMLNPEALKRLREIIRGAAAFDAGRNPGTP